MIENQSSKQARKDKTFPLETPPSSLVCFEFVSVLLSTEKEKGLLCLVR
jgi:hypothetical protein